MGAKRWRRKVIYSRKREVERKILEFDLNWKIVIGFDFVSRKVYSIPKFGKVGEQASNQQLDVAGSLMTWRFIYCFLIYIPGIIKFSFFILYPVFTYKY